MSKAKEEARSHLLRKYPADTYVEIQELIAEDHEAGARALLEWARQHAFEVAHGVYMDVVHLDDLEAYFEDEK